jgi:hypothetical protein
LPPSQSKSCSCFVATAIPSVVRHDHDTRQTLPDYTVASETHRFSLEFLGKITGWIHGNIRKSPVRGMNSPQTHRLSAMSHPPRTPKWAAKP